MSKKNRPLGADGERTPTARPGVGLYRQFLALPEVEQVVFIGHVLCDSESLFGKLISRIIDISGERHEKVLTLLKKLKQHRKPKQNPERDAEIMRLHKEGKSSASISKLLASKWPIKPSAVRRVIQRQNEKQFE